MKTRMQFNLSFTPLLLALCLIGPGCETWEEKAKMVDVQAEYLGLDDQRVAVMVAADSHMLYQYPDAPLNVCKAVTSRLTKNIPGITTTIPDEIARFKTDNPYWTNLPYGQLTEKLGVDKIVLIDLIEYQTHEPGNAHLWQGLITGNVGVIAHDAADPDNFVFHNTVSAQFPEASTVGVIDSDDETIQLGMVFLFAKRAAGLFYDHQVEAD